jgi:hypothetical protein
VYTLQVILLTIPMKQPFFEKVIGPLLVKNYAHFYGTRRFINDHTRARRLSLS